MNWKSFDWKYLLMFAATLVCALIPILWQSSQEARAITVKLLASTSLQPGSEAGIQDLQVTLNGRKIDDPYLSVLQVVNDGSKAILSNEFETPIELVTQGNASVVSAQITATDPKDIPVKLSSEAKKMLIAPFLSNPKDSVLISVITSGGRPNFGAHARIAGVKEIAFEDSSQPKQSVFGLAWKLIAFLVMAVLYFVFMGAGIRPLFVTRPLGYLTGLSSAMVCGTLLSTQRPTLELILPSGIAQFGVLVLLMGAALLIAVRIRRYS